MSKIVILQSPEFITEHPLEPILRKVTQLNQINPDIHKMSEDFKKEGVEFKIDFGKTENNEPLVAFIFGDIPLIGIKDITNNSK